MLMIATLENAIFFLRGSAQWSQPFKVAEIFLYLLNLKNGH